MYSFKVAPVYSPWISAKGVTLVLTPCLSHSNQDLGQQPLAGPVEEGCGPNAPQVMKKNHERKNFEVVHDFTILENYEDTISYFIKCFKLLSLLLPFFSDFLQCSHSSHIVPLTHNLRKTTPKEPTCSKGPVLLTFPRLAVLEIHRRERDPPLSFGDLEAFGEIL